MEEIKRFSTGIEELDKIIKGYIKGKSYLITGKAGVGKTILAMHFANGCCKERKKCIFISTEETPDDLRTQAESFGWDFQGHEAHRYLEITDHLKKEKNAQAKYSYQGNRQWFGNFAELTELVPDDADAVVIDNIGVLAIGLSVETFREQMDLLCHTLEEKGLTSLIVCDETVGEYSKDVATYSVGGAIRLTKTENPYTGKRDRVIDIIKMRYTSTPTGYIVFNIVEKGIEIASKG